MKKVAFVLLLVFITSLSSFALKRPKIIIGISGEAALQTYSINYKFTYTDPLGRLAYSGRLGVILSERYYLWINFTNYLKESDTKNYYYNLGFGYILNPKSFIGFYPKIELGSFYEAHSSSYISKTDKLIDVGLGAGLKLNKTMLSPFAEIKFQIVSRMPVLTIGAFLKI